jgi:hypothetical protein
MGDSAKVAGISASRQKNCHACVQAKRRCDRQAPICSRCVEKRATCVYSNIQTSISSQSRHENIQTPAFVESLEYGSSAYSHFSSGLSLGMDVDYYGVIPMDSQPDATNTATDSLHTSGMDVHNYGDTPMDSFTWLLDGSNTQQELVSTDNGSMADRPSTPIDEITQLAYQKMSCFCVSPIQSSYSVTTSIFIALRIILRMSKNALNNSFYLAWY